MANKFYVKHRGRYFRVEFVSAREFAEEMGVSLMTVSRWIHGGLPCWDIGDSVTRLRMIPRVDGKQWVVRQHARYGQ